MKLRTLCLVALFLVVLAPRGWPTSAAPGGERRYLYVAQPGIRNYVEYGGVGILVYDIDRGYASCAEFPHRTCRRARRRRT